MLQTIEDTLIKSFHESGYLLLRNVFSQEEVTQMRHEADIILERIINSSLANKRLSGRLDWRVTEDGVPIVRKIQPINDLSLVFSDISQDKRIITTLQQLMNDQPILMEEKLNYKQRLSQKIIGMGLPITTMNDAFPIHQDWVYFSSENYANTLISCAVFLDDCFSNSGPLHIWPGTHQELLEHELTANGWQVKPSLINSNKGIDLIGEAGSLVFFHDLLVHNSKPNISGQPRRLMIYTYYPQQYPMCFDVRNSPKRLSESPWEWEYMQKKNRGEYADCFTAP